MFLSFPSWLSILGELADEAVRGPGQKREHGDFHYARNDSCVTALSRPESLVSEFCGGNTSNVSDALNFSGASQASQDGLRSFSTSASSAMFNHLDDNDITSTSGNNSGNSGNSGNSPQVSLSRLAVDSSSSSFEYSAQGPHIHSMSLSPLVRTGSSLRNASEQYDSFKIPNPPESSVSSPGAGAVAGPMITINHVAKAMGALSSDSHPDLNKARSSLAHFMKSPAAAASKPPHPFAGTGRASMSFGHDSKEFGIAGIAGEGFSLRSPYVSFEDAEITEADCDLTDVPSKMNGRPGIGSLSSKEQHENEASDELEMLLTTDVRIVSMLKTFVPICASAAIETNTLQYLGELRRVVTLFIEIVNLGEDFSKGLIERPQQVFKQIMRPLLRFGGMLRQYVVDDKGCVLIAGFGVPGCNYEDNSTRALETAVLVRRNLSSMGVICRIGKLSLAAYYTMTLHCIALHCIALHSIA
jgi:hypothetical protein